MKYSFFPRVLSLLLALLLCASVLLACNNEPTPSTTPKDPAIDETPDTPTEPEPEQEPEPESPTYRILIASDLHCTDLMEWYGTTDEDRMQLWYDCVMAEHERQPFDLIIIAGDISLDTHGGETCYTKGYSTSQTLIEDFITFLPSDVPVFILPGNHETMPEEDWVALTGNSRQCTTVVGNNTFIMLDTFANIEGDYVYEPPYTQVDVEYVREQMDAYPENNVYLVAHHFPLDEGMSSESAAFREILCDDRVIGLFGGHTHLNDLVFYNESCGNKIQAQTGNFSYTGGSYDTAFWGFRDLIITEDSAITSYIQAECDVVLGPIERHYDRMVTEVVDFMDPIDKRDYVTTDGTVYTQLYDYIDYSSISGPTGAFGNSPANLLDSHDYTDWFPYLKGKDGGSITWEMTEDVTIIGYVIVSGTNNLPGDPKVPNSWILYGGDSPSLMEELDIRENVEMTSLSHTHSEIFFIDAPWEYKYYKLVFTGTSTGAIACEASELILLAEK